MCQKLQAPATIPEILSYGHRRAGQLSSSVILRHAGYVSMGAGEDKFQLPVRLYMYLHNCGLCISKPKQHVLSFMSLEMTHLQAL